MPSDEQAPAAHHGLTPRKIRWRRHKWQTPSGPAHHSDLWTPILQLLDDIGAEAQLLHVTSHMGL